MDSGKTADMFREEKKMIEIKGKYNEAKIFTDLADSASFSSGSGAL